MLVAWEQANAFLFARVMELVDVPDSKSGGVTCAGSSPALGTKGCRYSYYYLRTHGVQGLLDGSDRLENRP